MTSERLARGRAVVDEMAPGAAAMIEAAYRDIAPEMAQWILEFAFGDVASRNDLDREQRIVSNISALVALGNAEPQLLMQIRLGSSIGMSRSTLKGAILNVAPIAGLARTQNALRCVADLLTKDEANP